MAPPPPPPPAFSRRTSTSSLGTTASTNTNATRSTSNSPVHPQHKRKNGGSTASKPLIVFDSSDDEADLQYGIAVSRHHPVATVTTSRTNSEEEPDRQCSNSSSIAASRQHPGAPTSRTSISSCTSTSSHTSHQPKATAPRSSSLLQKGMQWLQRATGSSVTSSNRSSSPPRVQQQAVPKAALLHLDQKQAAVPVARAAAAASRSSSSSTSSSPMAPPTKASAVVAVTRLAPPPQDNSDDTSKKPKKRAAIFTQSKKRATLFTKAPPVLANATAATATGTGKNSSACRSTTSINSSSRSPLSAAAYLASPPRKPAATRPQSLPPSTASTASTALNTTWDNEDNDDNDDTILVWSGGKDCPPPSQRRQPRKSRNSLEYIGSSLDQKSQDQQPQASQSSETERPSTSWGRSASQKKHAPAPAAAQQEHEQDAITTTTATTSRSCWKCAVDLAVPNGEFCLYATHAHPVLNVPVCSVCADQVAAVESLETCAGCADDDDDTLVLFCCDKDDAVCGRVFCENCVAQAYGGGAAGRSRAQALQDDSEGTWLCLECEPPVPLQQLQLALENNDIAGADTGKTSVPAPRNLDKILAELYLAETAKRECEDMSTNEKDEEKRLEFIVELSESLSGADLDEAVQDELTEWKEVCYKHDLRLGDTIASLQDELETIHDVDLAACYEKLELKALRRQSDTADDRPDWARSADRELDLRRSAPAPDPSHPSVYKASIPTQVEDLATVEKEDGDDSLGEQWRHCNWKLSKEQIDEALEFEATEFGLDGPPVVSEAQDASETLAEEREVSTTSGNGRVRRDYQMVRQSRGKGEELPMARRGYQEPGLIESPKNRPKDDRDRGSCNSSFVTQPPSSALKESTPSDKISVASEYPSGGSGGDMFARSSLFLCSTSLQGAEKPTVRIVTVAKPFVKILKPHQIEGIKFIWENAFSDFAHCKSGDPTKVGGCILAHNMGLGKSLTCIALLHAVLNIPSMVCEKSRRPLLKSVLLVVPVNTVANWENEFRKWTDHLDPSIRVSNLTDVNRDARPTAIRGWENRGGVLLLSDSLFSRLMGNAEYTERLQPDILVLDEAHTTLSNKSNASYKALSSIKTPRRIALTGSPVQNNLLEYFMMVNWIRPNVFAMSESKFDKTFVVPIMQGMASDAPTIAVYNSMSQSKLLNEMLAPYVQRKDATELMKELPAMQQVVLHIRQSKMQYRLYRSFQKFQKTTAGTSYKNFFRMYTALRPIHNHPGCLTLASDKNSQTNASAKDDENDAGCGDEATSNSDWWMSLFKKANPEKLKEAENGFKIVLLLHILLLAEQIGDKVLVFSQCLKTLNFIEEVLSLDNWSEHVSSLASSFPGNKVGSWKKGREYLRIDGDISSAERGDLVEKFNNDEKDGGICAFLISSKAGGMGINLPAANRVVLFDSHFNPTVTTQAVFRAYRYGQDKEVFVYRLLTEGSIEEKVYSRSVNKTGVALRVVDGKSINRSFTAKELAAMQENYNWVSCEKCEKWRMVPFDVSEEELPDEWFCHMNFDTTNNTCKAPERSQLWYEKHLYSTDTTDESPIKCMARDHIDSSSSTPAKNKLVSNDVILKHLLSVTERQKKTTMISRFYFHEALLENKKDSTEEIACLREAIEAESKTVPSLNPNTSPKEASQITTASVKPASLKKKACSTSPSSQRKEFDGVDNSSSATTTSMTTADETVPKQKNPEASEVALEKATATLSKRATGTPSKLTAPKQKHLDASEVALEKATATPAKRAIGTPSKRTPSTSPKRLRRSLRHRSSLDNRKEQSSPEKERGRKRGLSPDTSLVVSHKDEPTPTKKHGRSFSSLRGTKIPSTLKQQRIKVVDTDAQEMPETAALGKKKKTRGGSDKKPDSSFKQDSPSPQKSQSDVAKPKARSLANAKSQPSSKLPPATEIIDLT